MRTCCMAIERIGRGGSVEGAQAALDVLRAEYDLAHQELTDIVSRAKPAAG
jgi:hypothetical protein